jgi:peptidyl-prolyl cis-trans isomerase C
MSGAFVQTQARLKFLAACLTLGCAWLPSVQAQSPFKDVRTVIASVNGIKVHSDMLEQMVSEGVANGAKDSPEFRAALKNELIARTVLAQEASKQGIEQMPATQNQLLMARASILANQVMARYVEKNPVTDEQIRNEYKRQLAGLVDAEQFLVRHVVLETEAQAQDALKSLRAGADFATLAKDKSLDNSKQNGGSLGWLLPNQLIPPLANVVVNLNKGAVSAAPIATSVGWQLIKLEDKRKFQPPTFEESKPLLLRSLQANQQNEYVQKLVKAAKVEDK